MPILSSSPDPGVPARRTNTRVAIRFANVDKRYRLGTGQVSLRETLSRILPHVGKQKAATPRGTPDAGLQKQIMWALRDISFELPAGHALGLIGPNGAGKTTALRLMAHITRPTSGRVEMNGRVSSLIELGAGFHPELTGRENVYLNAAILGMPQREAKRKFDQIVEFSGLERFIDTPVKHYSSGMYVRLGFAVAAHVDPDILLMDEVLAVGDAQFSQKCADRVAELRAKGTTIVFVSHVMPLVQSVCNEGIFLAGGRIQARGDVGEVIRAYEAHLLRRQMESPIESFGRAEILGTSVATIRQVEIKSEGKETQPSGELLYSDPVQVRVHFAVREPVCRPGLVVRIVGADGTVSCMIRSRDYGYVLDAISGEGVITVTIDPLQLASGTYSIDARLLGALDGSPLAMGHSPWFQVAGLSAGHGRTGGVFVPRVADIRVEPSGAVSQPFTQTLAEEPLA